MNLLHAWKTLIDSAEEPAAPIEQYDPIDPLVDLLEFAKKVELLETAHPWDLAPRVCRELHETLGYTPIGSWSRLVGLAAGTGTLCATTGGFVPMIGAEEVRSRPDEFRRRLVEAYTRKLIPPSAAAALYVALDVHPAWGLRLGRHVGSIHCDVAQSVTATLTAVEVLVFGTIATLIATLRGLRNDRMYSVDALGDVLWCAGTAMREEAMVEDITDDFPAPFLGPLRDDERRMVTTRMSILDVLDHVLVPAGVARRDDSGWFTARPERLLDVTVGPYGPREQEAWLSQLLWGTRRAC